MIGFSASVVEIVDRLESMAAKLPEPPKWAQPDGVGRGKLMVSVSLAIDVKSGQSNDLRRIVLPTQQNH